MSNLPIQLIDPELQNKIYDDLKLSIVRLSKKLQKPVNGLFLDWVELAGIYGVHKAKIARNRLEKFLHEVEKLEFESDDEIEESIHPQISGPIIQGIQHVDENGILEAMYINILVKALKKENTSKIHPAFSYKIQQLSPDEALILYGLKKGRIIEGSITYRRNDSGGLVERLGFDFDMTDFNLKFPDNALMYLLHLDSLELVEAGELSQEYTQLRDLQTEETTLRTQIHHRISLTPFAEYLADACIPDDIDTDGFQIKNL